MATVRFDARKFLATFRFGRRALGLCWSTSPSLFVLIAGLTALAGLLPAAAAYTGRLIVDAVVDALANRAGTDVVLRWVVIEALVIAAIAVVSRVQGIAQSLLRMRLGHRVNVMILEKALTLELRHFEDADFYDKLTRARMEASSRPLSLVMRSFGLVQNLISLVSFATLLWSFSAWAPAVLLLAGLPAFVAETKFSGDAFRLMRWRSPERRKQLYLEGVVASDQHAKEVQLFELGPLLLQRYREIFDKLFIEDRALTLRRGVWGLLLGLLGTATFYAAYGWIALVAAQGAITLGAMTMYLLLFKQGQGAVSAMLSGIGGMYEDNLYLSNLYEYLEQDVAPAAALPSSGVRAGAVPGDGLRFEAVSFTYPGADAPALVDIDLHVLPGHALALVGDNGAGKTTIIKLLARLYRPSSGRILLDGTDLRDWDEHALRGRIGAIFQDFVRYQLLVGENIGAGDVKRFDDEPRWAHAAEAGMAEPFIRELPDGYRTQLGKWFAGGRELSGGQWQKIALARAFMREDADVLVLDEPTSAMDAEAEAEAFARVRAMAKDKAVVLVSHRFSTVRIADEIVVLQGGRVIERGDHESLLAAGGRYARLFTLQAEAYR
ncbi:MAG: ABC transporter ATP-binding protein [Deltaproteobacteria bacterium]|nr:ABC transporter ATP-binding protein [Deltaproteobacteria bacterium]MBK8239162.1 ABC transporter ATP-binding protein [Deltaproteobacteria bacterium]MBK8717677.1 ABC transporter ATP-binding protein [Deltaproteobacteria bacterium]MBP7288620.1 ABC transporter ATP-binding protein [Nannocystaceae bacterium]